MTKNCSAQQVCDSLMGLVSFYKLQMAKMAEDHGLTIMQLHALRVISDGYNAMGSIAQEMHCEASTVTGIVDRLLALNLVTRKESARDRRVKTVELTTNGEAILQHIIRDMPTRLGCDQLQQKELNAIYSAVNHINPVN